MTDEEILDVFEQIPKSRKSDLLIGGEIKTPAELAFIWNLNISAYIEKYRGNGLAPGKERFVDFIDELDFFLSNYYYSTTISSVEGILPKVTSRARLFERMTRFKQVQCLPSHIKKDAISILIKYLRVMNDHHRAKKAVDGVSIMDRCYNLITKKLYNQDEYARAISYFIYIHSLKKSIQTKTIPNNTMLVVGPSGSGKTYALDILKESGLPGIDYISIDASNLTPTGYYGPDLAAILSQTIKEKNTSHLVVFLDEFDKLLMTGSRDVVAFRRAALGNILTLLEGSTNISEKGTEIDTTEMSFILSGSFDWQIKSDKQSSIGFGDMVDKRKVKSHSDINHETLMDLGLLPEISGRISHIVSLNEFTKEDYREIILEGRSSFSKHGSLLNSLGVQLAVSDDTLEKILDRAVDLRLGLRGLNQVIESTLQPHLFKLYTERRSEYVI